MSRPSGAGASAPAQVTTADVATALGVTPATVRSYRTRGYLPEPDGYLGRTPWWRPATITEWQATRSGQGVGGGRPKTTTTTEENR